MCKSVVRKFVYKNVVFLFTAYNFFVLYEIRAKFTSVLSINYMHLPKG